MFVGVLVMDAPLQVSLDLKPLPETVTDNVSEVPTVVEVGMLKVGAGTVTEAAVTVKDAAEPVAPL
jgi:hypothetical protein